MAPSRRCCPLPGCIIIFCHHYILVDCSESGLFFFSHFAFPVLPFDLAVSLPCLGSGFLAEITRSAYCAYTISRPIARPTFIYLYLCVYHLCRCRKLFSEHHKVSSHVHWVHRMLHNAFASCGVAEVVQEPRSGCSLT